MGVLGGVRAASTTLTHVAGGGEDVAFCLALPRRFGDDPPNTI